MTGKIELISEQSDKDEAERNGRKGQLSRMQDHTLNIQVRVKNRLAEGQQRKNQRCSGEVWQDDPKYGAEERPRQGEDAQPAEMEKRKSTKMQKQCSRNTWRTHARKEEGQG